MAAALVWLLLSAWPAHRSGLDAARPFAEQIHVANLAIVVGIEDRRSYQATLPFADRQRERDRVQAFAENLRRRRQGMFADGHHLLLGARIGQEPAAGSASACPGELHRIVRLLDPLTRRPLGVRAEGGLRPGALPRNTPLLLVDAQRQVVGLGTARGSRWVAFARPRTTPTHLFALGEAPVPCFALELPGADGTGGSPAPIR